MEKYRLDNKPPMERRTYAIYGLMEMTVVIPVGRASLKVEFSGGSMTAGGVKPALYSTSNPAVARLIEGSRLFSSGRISRID